MFVNLIHIPLHSVFRFLRLRREAKCEITGDRERSHRDLAGRTVSARTLAARTGNGTPCPGGEAGRINGAVVGRRLWSRRPLYFALGPR